MALLLQTQGSRENTWHLQGGIQQKVPGRWTRQQGDKGGDEEEGKAGRLLSLRGSGKHDLRSLPPTPKLYSLYLSGHTMERLPPGRHIHVTVHHRLDLQGDKGGPEPRSS